MKKLTKRQREIHSHIIGYREEHGISPSIVEVATDFEISPNAARDHIEALVKKGALIKTPGKNRSLRPPKH